MLLSFLQAFVALLLRKFLLLRILIIKRLRETKKRTSSKSSLVMEVSCPKKLQLSRLTVKKETRELFIVDVLALTT